MQRANATRNLAPSRPPAARAIQREVTGEHGAPAASRKLTGDAVHADPLVRELLGKRLVGVLATLEPNGAPHVVPLWYAAHGTAVVLATSSRSRKVRNLRREPRATLCLHDSRSGSEVCGASLHGRVELVGGPDAAGLVDLVHRRYLTDAGEMLPDVQRVPRLRRRRARPRARACLDMGRARQSCDAGAPFLRRRAAAGTDRPAFLAAAGRPLGRVDDGARGGASAARAEGEPAGGGQRPPPAGGASERDLSARRRTRATARCCGSGGTRCRGRVGASPRRAARSSGRTRR